MNKILNILFVPIDAIGHVNACIGIAEVLKERGHKIIFAINESWNGKLVGYGFQEELITESERDPNENPAKFWANVFTSGGSFMSLSALEKTINLKKNLMPFFIKQTKNLDSNIGAIIKRLKPDLMILDQVLCVPSVVTSGIPWILSCSFNPLLFIEDERTPPSSSGLPAFGHEDEWKNFRTIANNTVYETWKEFNEYVVSKGVEPLPEYIFTKFSPYLNIYGFPLELDYLNMRPLPPNWYRFDNLKRTGGQHLFEVPQSLRERSGKLIYFSMGSMGGADVKLMERLINILSKSPHRFIVSKGPLHEQIELSDNMWGKQSVPQIEILPIVDLVITHGGNNTITETFYFGKPMIVMPLFGDQYDNAQRVDEKGFGIRLDPYKCNEHEFLESIDKLLNDQNLKLEMKRISNRIQSENSISKISELVENLFENI